MEKELAFLLLLPQMRQMETLPSDCEIQEVIDKLDRMPFGQLVRHLNDLCDTGDFCEKLKDALLKRNQLAHHYFDKYRNKLDDPDTHRHMRVELSAMKRQFEELFDVFHSVNAKLMLAIGICNENGDLLLDD